MFQIQCVCLNEILLLCTDINYFILSAIFINLIVVFNLKKIIGHVRSVHIRV